MESKGTGSSFVSLGGGDVLKNSPDHWGGIQVLGSGSFDFGDWTFFSKINPAKPRFLGSSAGDDWVSVRYDYGGAPFILKGKFAYETRLSADEGTTWSAWSGQPLLPGQTRYEDTTYEYREEGLREVTDYLLSVRAMSFSNPSDFIGRTSDTLLVRVRTLGTEDLGAVVLEPTYAAGRPSGHGDADGRGRIYCGVSMDVGTPAGGRDDVDGVNRLGRHGGVVGLYADGVRLG